MRPDHGRHIERHALPRFEYQFFDRKRGCPGSILLFITLVLFSDIAISCRILNIVP